MPRKMRVLFVFEGLYARGAERVSLSLISQLDRSQIDPRIWILRPKDDLRAEVPPDVPVSMALAPGQRIRHRILSMPLGLLREAARADVIVATVEFMPTYCAAFAGLLTGKPVVAWVHNAMNESFRDHSALHQHLARLIYPRVPRVVFVSEGTRRTLQSLIPMPDSRLRVIHNPLDLARVQAWQQQPLPEWARFMHERPTVVGVGRLTRQKGFELLIEAHAQLRAEGVSHDLLILGEGGLRPNLEALVRQLGVQDSVHLPGHIDNPYPFMRHASVFALSSRFEGLPTVLIEAMACGTPVVAADCPSGPAEILEGGRWGRLVPAGDSAVLARELGMVLKSGALQRTLSEAGLRRIQDFAPERVVPAWEAVLRGVAGRKDEDPKRASDLGHELGL